MTKLHYYVGASRPTEHKFDVTIAIPETGKSHIELRLPAWIPGSYKVRDYARHVMTVHATDAAGESLAVSRKAKSIWHVATGNGATRVELVVYGWDLSVRGAHIDQDHAYFNGVCLCPEIVDFDGPISVTIERPAGLPQEAIVATSMRPVDIDNAGFGLYQADDYDELIDHPVEIAVQQRVSFDAAGIPHHFYLRDAGEFDARKLAADCARICEHHHTLLGTPPDLDRYVFLAYVTEQAYGGLEHRWSSSLAISRASLPQPDGRTDDKAYRTLLGLISHEYFHLWNVKRLKPAAFVPMDMSREVHTSLLWVFEGITSYYDDLGLMRSGVIDPDSYFDLLARNLTRVLRTPARLQQTLSESSFDTWTKFYQQDENAPNAVISYYAKGALVALALDLKLRLETDITLDHVMRECWQRYYVADGSGMPEDGLERVVNDLTGTDFTAFFDQALRTTDDPDLAPLLASVGLIHATRVAGSSDDIAGAATTPLFQVYTGFRLDPRQTGRIAAVINGSPAADAGVSAGDMLVAVDNIKADKAIVDRLHRTAKPGQQMCLHVFRGERLLQLSITLAPPVADIATLTLAERSDAAVEARRSRWLHASRWTDTKER